MLLFLSLSTAEQHVWLLPRFQPGEVSRTRDVRHGVGGKAVNAARAAALLGGSCVLVGFFDDARAAHVRGEGIEVDAVDPGTPIRRATSVVDLATGAVSELVEEARPPRAAALDEAVRRFTARARDARVVCLCGSLPHGAPAGLYARLLAAFPHTPAVVDTQGEALRAALAGRPFLVKPNRAEIGALVGRTAISFREVAEHAAEVRRLGAQHVAVSCGAEGLLLAGEDAAPLLFRPPAVKPVNATGCGDAVTGAVAAGLAEGLPLGEAVRLGVAAGTASALDPLPGSLDPDAARDLVSAVQVTEP
jgi:1-phosphofructokinase family hexose kinase